MRLDMYVKEYMNISRQKARELIEQGAVSVDGRTAVKPSLCVGEASEVQVGNTENVLKYAGRGGYKLEGAIECFGIDLRGFTCLDIGASTGGFTDCMLQNGAKAVYAVDVGTGQLCGRIKADDRVISMENTDIRAVSENMTGGRVDFIGCDVSFISLTRVLPSVKRLLKENGDGVLLIKPQFECGREFLNKGGIVKNKKVHKRVIREIISAAAENGLSAIGLARSPIQGGDGNSEYLLYIKNDGCTAVNIDASYIDRITD